MKEFYKNKKIGQETRESHNIKSKKLKNQKFYFEEKLYKINTKNIPI